MEIWIKVLGKVFIFFSAILLSPELLGLLINRDRLQVWNISLQSRLEKLRQISNPNLIVADWAKQIEARDKTERENALNHGVSLETYLHNRRKWKMEENDEKIGRVVFFVLSLGLWLITVLALSFWLFRLPFFLSAIIGVLVVLAVNFVVEDILITRKGWYFIKDPQKVKSPLWLQKLQYFIESIPDLIENCLIYGFIDFLGLLIYLPFYLIIYPVVCVAFGWIYLFHWIVNMSIKFLSGQEGMLRKMFLIIGGLLSVIGFLIDLFSTF